MALTTDTAASFQGSMMDMVGYQMSKLAADKCYKATGLTPNDVQVVELHDCFSANEVRIYKKYFINIICTNTSGANVLDQLHIFW